MGCITSQPQQVAGNDSGRSVSGGSSIVRIPSQSQPSLTNTTPEAPTPKQHHLREMLVHEHSGDPWADGFEKIRLLGCGLSGSVFLVRNKKTGLSYAMKSLQRDKLPINRLEDFRNEVELLRTLDHPNVIKLIEFFETKEGNLFLIFEELAGGELFDRLNLQPGGFFSENDALTLLVQVSDS
jgi:hypothetical protein